jgi:predicted transcriptional regulator
MGTRKMYNTTLDTKLIREIKVLAARLDKRQNDILEEAIQDLLKKYKSQDSLDIGNESVAH